MQAALEGGAPEQRQAAAATESPTSLPAASNTPEATSTATSPQPHTPVRRCGAQGCDALATKQEMELIQRSISVVQRRFERRVSELSASITTVWVLLLLCFLATLGSVLYSCSKVRAGVSNVVSYLKEQEGVLAAPAGDHHTDNQQHCTSTLEHSARNPDEVRLLGFATATESGRGGGASGEVAQLSVLASGSKGESEGAAIEGQKHETANEGDVEVGEGQGLLDVGGV